MSTRYHKQSERPRFLRLVDSHGKESNAYLTASAETIENDPGPVPEPVEDGERSHEASTIIGNAVAHAAMSWVACCQEKQGVTCLGGASLAVGSSMPR